MSRDRKGSKRIHKPLSGEALLAALKVDAQQRHDRLIRCYIGAGDAGRNKFMKRQGRKLIAKADLTLRIMQMEREKHPSWQNSTD